MMEISCPFHTGSCTHSLEIPEIPLPKVFFAYDSRSEVTDSIEMYFGNILNDNGVKLIKAEDVTTGAGSKEIMCEKICRQIKESIFIVADIGKWDETSSRYSSNPNVTFEVGLALGFNKPVMLLTASYKDLPFDFCGINVYSYKGESGLIFSKDKLDKYVKPEIEHILRENTYLPAVKVLIKSESNKILCKIEKHYDGRFLVKRWLSSITRTEKISKEILKSGGYSKEECNAERERIKVFEEKLKVGHTYVDIYNIHDVEDYLKRERNVVESTNLIKERIGNIINLLKKNRNYEIYLTDKRVAFDYEICGDKVLIISGGVYRDIYKMEERNVDLIYFTIPRVIREFKKEFNNMQKNIGEDGCKNKTETIHWFENQLSIIK